MPETDTEEKQEGTSCGTSCPMRTALQVAEVEAWAHALEGALDALRDAMARGRSTPSAASSRPGLSRSTTPRLGHFFFDSCVKLHFPPPPFTPKSKPLLSIAADPPPAQDKHEEREAPRGKDLPPGNPLLLQEAE
ncbi:hypothetical protein FB451DRAFT_1394052 [Mycena latifolia]|nr:hypothetical protein FB451DRAFT_1394052 [Mycena latifolia]